MATRQQVSADGVWSAGRWLPDGNGIVYENWQREMVLARVEQTGDGLRIGERSTLFDTTGRNYWAEWDFRLDPQGRGLVIVKNVGGSSHQSVVVLNFLEEFKGRLGR